MRTVYKFKDHVYALYAPYYDKYKGHKFVVDHVSKEDSSGEHVWLVCVTCVDLDVDGYVHFGDLEEVDIDVEQTLADILQQEIWKEITASTGKTKQDYDNELIEILKGFANASNDNKNESNKG